MSIFFYKGVTRNPEIKNSLTWVLLNIWRLGRVRDTKFGANVSNKILLNAAKCKRYSFCRFWVIKGKLTGRGEWEFPSPSSPRLWLNRGLCCIFTADKDSLQISRTRYYANNTETHKMTIYRYNHWLKSYPTSESHIKIMQDSCLLKRKIGGWRNSIKSQSKFAKTAEVKTNKGI